MSLLSEYMRRAHPSCKKMYRAIDLPVHMRTVSVPVDVVTRGKVIVMVAIALSYLLPQQWAAVPGIFAGAYWLFKL